MRKDFQRLSEMAGPKIRKMARRRKLTDHCFKVFQRAAYPDATQEQVEALRIAFFAGVCELHTMMMYALSTDTVDVTDDDMDLWGCVVEEFEKFHEATLARVAERTRNMKGETVQ